VLKEITNKHQSAPPKNQLELSPFIQDLAQKKPPVAKTKIRVKSRFQWVTSEDLLETKDKKLICENEVNTKFIN
jgi:hypothetical protein